MSLYFGNNDEAQEDAAQIEIAGLMDMRRRALREQMIADEVRNDLCNAVLEWRAKLGVSQASIAALRDCSDPDSDVRKTQHALYEYIRRLETFQSVFWCQKCNTMNTVKDKPEGFSESVPGNTSAAMNAPLNTPTPTSACDTTACDGTSASDNILDTEIPEYLSMDEIVIILRGLQQEVKKLRNAGTSATRHTDVADFVEKYGYVPEGFPADGNKNFFDGYTDKYDHCDDRLTADDF